MYENRRKRKAKRKSLLIKGGILIGGLCLAAGIIAGSIMLIRHFSGEEIPHPAATLNAYAQYLQNGQYEEIYQLLDESSRAAVTSEELVERYKNIYGGVEATDIVLTLDIPSTEEKIKKKDTEHPVSIEYHIAMNTLAGELTFPSCTILTYAEEENTWKMIWDLEEIFPGLKQKYKVRIKTETAERGQIYDCQNNLMAGIGQAWSAGIVPGKLEEPREDAIIKAAEAMGISAEKVQKALSAAWVKDDLFVPIRTFSKTNTVLQEQVLAVPGIMLMTVHTRVYPYGAAAGHLTGYVQSITAEELEKKKGEHYHSQSMIGKTGLEASMESVLRNRDGYRIVIVDEQGAEVEEVLKSLPERGEDVRLSINAPLQKYMYEVLAGDKGAAAALNPETGEVLAYVSSPSYDSNDFVYGFTSAAWEAINADPAQPLFNRAKSTFCPGSVMKPITASLALEAGTLTTEDTVDYKGNAWTLDASWGSYYVSTLHSDYQPKNLKNALIYSDNIFFAQAAVKLGADKLASGYDSFGFGETPDFPLKLTASSYGGREVLADSMVLADSGYGHGQLMMNPLHLACMYSAFYNDGNIIAPTLLAGSEPSFWKTGIMSSETADIIRKDLVEVVNNPNGTGKAAKMDDRIIAGKTGTAELKASKDDKTGTEIGWFVGMNGEKCENPIIIVMAIEDVKDRGGSSYTAEKVKDCLTYYYQYRE